MKEMTKRRDINLKTKSKQIVFNHDLLCPELLCLNERKITFNELLTDKIFCSQERRPVITLLSIKLGIV